MLLKIAWRNLWRNKRRSIIILASIIVGVASLFLYSTISAGFAVQMLENQISFHTSHIQIHKKGYENNKNVHKLIPNPGKVENILKNSTFIINYSKRVIVYGLLSSASASSGAAIIGIEPNKEKLITNISKKIIKGTYLANGKNEIVIGQKMAEKLDVTIGDKVVTVVSDIHGHVSNALFRIVGIFKTGSAVFDRTFLYIPLATAQKTLEMGNNFNEFAMITRDEKKTGEYKKELEQKIDGDYEILTYQELLPLIMKYIEIFDQMIYIIYMVIYIAVLFGIINTMLMSVFERVQEFGVLMSIGMKNTKIFSMVLQEAFVLGLLGTLLGFALGLLIYLPLSYSGVDLGIYNESLSSFGMGSIIYPKMNLAIIINSIVIMPIATVVGAIYPARKAIKLQPTDAMRYV